MTELTIKEAERIYNELYENGMEVNDLYKKACLFDYRFADNKARNVSIASLVIARRNGVSVKDYIFDYVISKLENVTDKGRYGDIREVFVGYFMRKFTTLNQIHVKENGKIDLTVGGVQYEIGHNGKTFTRCAGFTEIVSKEDFTVDMILANEPNYIVYGCIDSTVTDVDIIAKQCRKYMYVFHKTEFAQMLCEVKKGGFQSAIKFCPSGVTIQYNSQFLNDFSDWIDKHPEIPTVEQFARHDW